MSTSTSSSCSAGDSFRIAGFQLDAYDGCYSASETTTFNFLPVFYVGGVPADGPVVYASDLFGSLTDETYVWAIGNYNSTQDVVDVRLCYDEDGADATTTHPAEVAAWLCDGGGSTTTTTEDGDATGFTVWCGCATPAPTTTGTDGRDFTLSPAPVALAAEEVVNTSEDDGMPTPVIIVTAFAVFVVVAIILAIAFEGLRKGLWMCISCKRESTSEDSGVSSSSSRGQAA
ncbi:unnamed protein product [Ectocarpus fasciculatus]